MIIRKFIAAVMLLGFCTSMLAGPSTVNPAVPANGALLQSAPLRANFSAAANDINALISQNGGTTAPSSPVLGQQWLNTSATPYVLNEWDGTNWVQIGNLNPSTHQWTITATSLPTATTSALGVMQAGTGLSVSSGVVTPAFGTGANQVVQGGVITAGGPVGSATVAPVITYNAAGQLTNVSSATITPAIGSVTGLGTGVSGALGTAVGSAGSFVANGGALGTPSSGTLTNATGLPVSTGVSGLGAGVASALGNAVSGSGSVCLTTSCAMTTPNLGTPSAATLTNATGLPLSGLTSQSANTIVGTTTATSPSALSIPSCSTSGSALNWTSGTGFSCNTSIAANTATSATNAASATNATNLANTGAVSTNAIFYPQFVVANATSNQGGNTASSLAFNPSTGTLSATTFSGAGTSLTGTAASLNIGGNAAGLSSTLAVASGGTGVTSAQGNGTKVQLSSGSTTSGDCVKFDANGNTVDAGAACSGGGGSGTVNSGSAGQLGYYSSSGTVISGLSSGSLGQCLISNGPGSAPSYQACTGGTTGLNLMAVTTSALEPQSATPVSSGMSVNVVSGGTYSFEIFGYLTANTGAAFTLNFGTATMTSVTGVSNPLRTTGNVANVVITSYSQSINFGNEGLIITGTFVVNAGGTFNPGFAATSSGTDTLLAGSWMRVIRIN